MTMTTTAQRVKLYDGTPPSDGSSMPTCGVCKTMIPRGEAYAGVLYEGEWASDDGRREVRHYPGCVEWRTAKSREVQVGDKLMTFRFEQEGRGTFPVIVTDIDPADTDKRGWRAVWARDAADETAEPVKAYQSPEELVHLIRA
jgi:hypothetical protein